MRRVGSEEGEEGKWKEGKKGGGKEGRRERREEGKKGGGKEGRVGPIALPLCLKLPMA